jgi:hypothetical protein
MKMKLKSIILLTVSAFALNGCTKDFVKINTNPNESAKVAPQGLLGPTIYKTLVANLNRNMRVNNELMQVTVTTNDNLEFHRYEVRATETEYMWSNWYVQLTNIRDIYKRAGEAQQSGYKIYQGISKVLDVWVSSLITDMYGDVPYFDSNLGYHELNTTPKFDRQIDIYRDLFLKLEQANQLLTLPSAVTASDLIPEAQHAMDPIYSADALKWRKFANSLYLRLLLRVSHKPELSATLKIKEILETNSSEYPIMQSHDDSAILYFSGQEPYINPYLNSRPIDFNGNKGYADYFIDNLQRETQDQPNDPRLAIWATQPTLGVYAGMISGYQRGRVPEIQSTYHPSFQSHKNLGNIMNYAELQFIKAECMLRQFVSGDAKKAYEEGVTSAINLWGVNVPTGFFGLPRIGFLETDSNTDLLKKVHLQKYYALLFTDFQQWYEYRRTGLLDLYVGPGLQNNGKMPVRMPYPLITQAVNKANFDEAVARMGGNTPNTLMWWQPTN